MSAFESLQFTCICGAEFSASVATQVNAVRSPGLRDAILAGTFNRIICPDCGLPSDADIPFLYIDPARGLNVRVLASRHWYKLSEAGKGMALILGKPRDGHALPQQAHSRWRVVYGLGGLREKVLAQDLGIDDRKLELLKVAILHEHPVLLRGGRPVLRLVEETARQLRFMTDDPRRQSRFMATIGIEVASRILGNVEVLQQWAGRCAKPSLLDEPADPQDGNAYAVDTVGFLPYDKALAKLAEWAKMDSTETISNKELEEVLEGLPISDVMPAEARRNIAELKRKYSENTTGDKELSPADITDVESAMQMLLEAKFGKIADTDWFAPEFKDRLPLLWRLLESLPDFMVEGNVSLKELDVGERNSGSTYDPEKGRVTVSSGAFATDSKFEYALLHEVGHSVHDRFKSDVDAWLTREFGWKTWERSSDPDWMDPWVNELGGWLGNDPVRIARARTRLSAALGYGGHYDRAKIDSDFPAGDPWFSEGEPARKAFEKSGNDWWKNLQAWVENNENVFAANFYYSSLMMMKVATRDFILNAMRRPYAAMSPSEFFADLFAEAYVSRSATEEEGAAQYPLLAEHTQRLRDFLAALNNRSSQG